MASPPQPEPVVKECIVCYQNTAGDSLNNDLAVVELSSCKCHRTCLTCFATYLRTEISEGRVNLTCPECPEGLHPADVRKILAHRSHSVHANSEVKMDAMFAKYEEFMVRRVLARDEPDARWCPSPDCNYAVIASGCASCPRLECQREGCGTAFCYNCKQLWHPDTPCNLFSAAASMFSSPTAATTTSTAAQTVAIAAGSNILQALPRSILKHADPTSNLGLIKPCPTCQALIAKTEDGSCNHMTCAMCGTDFCWLCLKPVSDLHFLSPSGCTFWGKRPWSRKKKLWCQVGTLIGAPVGIALVAGLAIPAILVGVPVFTGRKIYRKMENRRKWKRNTAVTLGVIGAAVGAPLAAVFAVGVGVPCMVAYVYGVVPFALVRNSLGNGNSPNIGAANGTRYQTGVSLETALKNAEEQQPKSATARIIAVDERGHAVILSTLAASSMQSTTRKDGNDVITTVDETAPGGGGEPSVKKARFFSHLLRRSNRSGGGVNTSNSISHSTKVDAAAEAIERSGDDKSNSIPFEKNKRDVGNSSCGCRCHRRREDTDSFPCEHAPQTNLSTSVSSNLRSTEADFASHENLVVICNSCGCGGGADNISSSNHHRCSFAHNDPPSANNNQSTTHRCYRQPSTTTTATASSSVDTQSCSITSTNVSLYNGGGGNHAACCSVSMLGVTSLAGKKRCCSYSNNNAVIITTTVTRREEPEALATVTSVVSNDNASMNGLAGSLACAKCGVAGVKTTKIMSIASAARDSQSYAGCLDHQQHQRRHTTAHDVKSEACGCASVDFVTTNAKYRSNNESKTTAAGVSIQPSSTTLSNSINMVRKARAGDSVSVTALSRDDGLSVNEDVIGGSGSNGGIVGVGGVFKYYDSEILSVASGKSSKKSDVK